MKCGDYFVIFKTFVPFCLYVKTFWSKNCHSYKILFISPFFNDWTLSLYFLILQAERLLYLFMWKKLMAVAHLRWARSNLKFTEGFEFLQLHVDFLFVHLAILCPATSKYQLTKTRFIHFTQSQTTKKNYLCKNKS